MIRYKSGLAGVTFDTGGYNIKAGAGSMIDMMKFDSATLLLLLLPALLSAAQWNLPV